MSGNRARVGILTFHWATNYGAVLQSYALQHVLRGRGISAEIIDFIPYRVYLAQTLQRFRRREYKEFIKEFKLQRFLRSQAGLSSKMYFSQRAVARTGRGYDAIVVGSDQIWNENLTMTGERGPLRAYFLHEEFGSIVRVAYAASFGASSVSSEYLDVVRPLVTQFDSVGVRENSGVKIVREMGIQGALLLDPALLLSRDDYLPFIGANHAGEGKLVTFILHQDASAALRIAEKSVASRFPGSVRLEQSPVGVGDWLGTIASAGFVLTNSYHAVVFCVLFQVPFLVVPVGGGLAGMNDRMTTLLSNLGLQNRMLDDGEAECAAERAAAPIEWRSVAERLDCGRSRSLEFLDLALVPSKSDWWV